MTHSSKQIKIILQNPCTKNTESKNVICTAAADCLCHGCGGRRMGFQKNGDPNADMDAGECFEQKASFYLWMINTANRWNREN